MDFLSNIGIELSNAGFILFPIWILGMAVSRFNKQSFQRATDVSWYTKKDKFFSFGTMVLMVVFMGIALFIPFTRDSVLFYIGFIILSIGIIGHFGSKINYMNGKPNEVINEGFYKISRNPSYFFFSLIFLSVTMITSSYILFIFWCIIICFNHMVILSEEQYCLKTYGKSYEEYMKKVPRYLKLF